MMQFCIIYHAILPYREVTLMDEERAILVDLPTSVRGFVYLDDNGDPKIVVNARLTREQNRRTWDHEKEHINRGDMNEPNYIEYE